MVSAVAFDPQGRLAVAGLLNGLCVLYQTDRLSYYTQVECRNRHGRLRDGRKVTGISFLPTAKQMLVTTNDSRARLINTDDFTTQCKFKGVVNRHMQIRATPSEDGKRIISGSDDNHVCVWRTEHEYGGGGGGVRVSLGRSHPHPHQPVPPRHEPEDDDPVPERQELVL